jgi:hypothetical protein
MKSYRKKINKVSKGYRLKPETHRLVNKIQKSINGDRDEAVAAACLAYFNILELNGSDFKKELQIQQRRAI